MVRQGPRLTGKKNVVRSTKETLKRRALEAAQDLALEIRGRVKDTPREFTFKHYATQLIAKGREQVERGERNNNYIRTQRLFLDNGEWGLMQHFAARDVRQLKTRDYLRFMDDVRQKRPDLSPSTCTMLMAAFRNVLKVARDDGAIDEIPATPRIRQKDNPRPYFHFAPLVPKERDEWEKLKNGAKRLAGEGIRIRGVPITEELYDLILFCVHSFVRPTTAELYALKRKDIALETNPKRLLVTVRNGKTGHRTATTTEGAVAPYNRLCKRYPNARDDDYLFLPHYPNRATAAHIFQRQFNLLLKRTGLKRDAVTNKDRSVYSLRHNAICMRIVLSKDQVNIFTLARNAGTSIEQIERFYTKYLPLSGKMAENLQTFGD